MQEEKDFEQNKELDLNVEDKEKELKTKEEELRLKEKELKEKEENLIIKEDELKDTDKKLSFKKKRLEGDISRLEEREELIEEEEEKLAEERKKLSKREAVILEESEERVEQRIKDLIERNKILADKIRDMDELKLRHDLLKKELEAKEELFTKVSHQLIELSEKVEQYKKNESILSKVSLEELYSALDETNERNKALEEENKNLTAKLESGREAEELAVELQNSNSILKSRLNRTRSYIDYLKRIEESKGVGEDASTQIFKELIQNEKARQKGENRKSYLKDRNFVNQFIEFCKDCSFRYEAEVVRAFLASVKSSKFTILKGYSGTGKSALPQLFSMFLGAECVVIPVQPNWRTKQDLMGFYNYFTNKYIPTEFTKTLIRAKVNSDKIFFMILDEMNLARVEYYFSEFNSKLELDEDKRIVELYEGSAAAKDEEVSAYIKGNSIEIPKNVFFIGTINEDDSVSPISDKIFDRAQVIEFMQRPSIDMVGNLEEASYKADKNKVTTYKSFIVDRNLEFKEDLSIVEEVNRYIEEEFNRVIGYRSIRQIRDFVNTYVNSGGEEASAVDMQLVSKFIPKFKFAYSDDHKEKIFLLSEHVKELFIKKYKFKVDKASELNFVKQLNKILREFSS